MTDKKTHYPIDFKGNMLEKERYHYNLPEDLRDKWEPMKDFTTTLKYIGYQKGRSSLRFIVEDSCGKTYSMMASSIDTFVLNSYNGEVTAVWEFVKRGSYYGIQVKEIL